MRKEHASFFRQLNEKVEEMNELTKDYNHQANKLHDAILTIRELKVKLRERNVPENSNTPLPTTEGEVVVPTATFKKLPDPPIFTDDKDPIIDD
jgi:hypothetical protein